MTKKDYVLIAGILKSNKAQHGILNDFANALKRDNPKFDEIKFFQACGINLPDHYSVNNKKVW